MIVVDRRIRNFFDKAAGSRDVLFSEDPVLNYEQRMRQKAICSFVSNETFQLALDAGCGNGRDFAVHLKISRVVVGLDPSERMLREARKRLEELAEERVHLVLGDVTSPPFKDGSFDLICCSEVLEHVPLLAFRRLQGTFPLFCVHDSDQVP
jgi:ubiquinone/menaquinone biosynthesis C-methylase UbiE